MNKNKEIVNIIYNVIYKCLNVLFPLISAGIVARRLLPIGVGKVSAAQNIVTYFTFLAPLGLSIYGVREISKVEGKELNILFSEFLALNAISTTIFTFLYYSLINFCSYFESDILLYNIVGISIVFNFLNIEWFYQGKGEYKYITIRSTLIKLFMLISVLLFVNSQNDYIKYALICCIAAGGNYILNFIHLKSYSINLVYKDLHLGRHVKALIILLISNIAVELYSLVDTTMLSFFCEKEIVAYYTNSMKVVKVAIFVVAAIGGTTLQRIAPLIKQNKILEIKNIFSKIINIMFLLSIPCIVGLECVSCSVIKILYGEMYLDAVPTMRILVFLFLSLPFSNFIGTQILIAYNKEHEILFTQICAAFINIILNYYLIKIYRQNGAAIASVISEAFVMVVMFFFAYREIKFDIKLKYIFQIVFFSIIMGFAIIFVNKLIYNEIIKLFVSVLVGLSVYSLLLLLFKNNIILAVGDKEK